MIWWHIVTCIHCIYTHTHGNSYLLRMYIYTYLSFHASPSPIEHPDVRDTCNTSSPRVHVYLSNVSKTYEYIYRLHIHIYKYNFISVTYIHIHMFFFERLPRRQNISTSERYETRHHHTYISKIFWKHTFTCILCVYTCTHTNLYSLRICIYTYYIFCVSLADRELRRARHPKDVNTTDLYIFK